MYTTEMKLNRLPLIFEDTGASISFLIDKFDSFLCFITRMDTELNIAVVWTKIILGIINFEVHSTDTLCGGWFFVADVFAIFSTF